MKKIEVEGMTIAVSDMNSMLDFYRALFHVEFTAKEMYGSTLYSGNLGQLQLLFCPAEIAQNTAKQNRHQLDIIVETRSRKRERELSFPTATATMSSPIGML